MPSFPKQNFKPSDSSEFDFLDASQQLVLQQTSLGLELLEIVNKNKIQCVFQPIIDITKKKACAFEGLVRGPFQSSLHNPLNLFQVAEEQGVLYEVDTFVRMSTIESFAKQVSADEHLHLFLNISVNAVMNPSHQPGLTLQILEKFGISPEKVVIEITELQPIEDFEAFVMAINYYRSNGFKVAIDDLGSGYNCLRIWSEVKPDFVKIDRHFVSDIDLHEEKQAFMSTLMTLAKSTHTRVVAEGVETEKELEVLIRLGVELVQGYLFKKPNEIISEELLYVWPENNLVSTKNSTDADEDEVTVRVVTFDHPVINPGQQIISISELFLAHPEYDYFPIVDDNKVLGMVWRRDLMNLVARKFGQELNARKSVSSVMDANPIVVDAKMTLVSLSRLVTDDKNFAFRDAFIIQQNNQYLGCGNFKDLLRKITDLKVQRAQYANPLSGLPGNVPIQKKLNKLLNNKKDFMVIYIDVDNFKPFNDYYSFAEGDGVIELIAQILTDLVPESQISKGETFIGHIGGDDFVVMSTQINKHQKWSEKILKKFQQKSIYFYNEEDRQAQGICAKNRSGEEQFFPLMSLSIGILMVNPKLFEHTQKLASYATKAKKGAKAAGGNTFFIVDARESV